MADNIVLFVFEGSKTEPQILENLKQHYFSSEKSTFIRAIFGTHIYALWDVINKDRFLDLVEIIRERNTENRVALEGISREEVDRIYLFFDHDGHDSKASDETIKKMLAHFNSPNENGMLYISYPMVEALKHLKQDVDFKDIFVSAKETIKCEERQLKYKQLVDCSTDFLHIYKLTKHNWQYIIAENYKKANFIVHDCFDTPDSEALKVLNQENIFTQQLEKYIIPREMLAVLSAFPFFINEYFGENHVN